ncbi:hypothetical protein LU699_03305 [Luteimonas fraxinea]|uniref:HXXEE domain-containing protein n=1 Tax=Luteimonas fraxinea TaxID=2901869 RepID=A0ABS8UC17_9GAMM|nr:hypothetical protein [Luteimonas fraxinea]MCD9096055.1 hypothetical protein [Luteimonas fraxinea]UHH10773.1 hypothetical protein LU699_03305 [Luteimonas fraxinea]
MRHVALAHSRSWRVWLVAAVLLAELAHLAWEHLHGGIVSHHLLARPDLPAVWNGWGLVLLPALTWFVTGRVARRVERHANPGRAMRIAWLGFVIAAALGAALSIAFVSGVEDAAFAVLLSALVLGLVLPAYRAECLLGFVLAMTFTFGAVLPLLIGGIVATVSAIAHLGLYALARRVWRRTRGRAALA